jgi:crotonobetainyl-CoA:carnitine CoA-transferase CaiB-like acyl-CoA transferase
VEEVSDRSGKQIRIPGKPWRFSKDQLHPAAEPSYRGEDNAEILRELGYDDAEIETFAKAGVILSNVPAGRHRLP